jgi:bifunctional UDP-N-acetylglucosamine pyrophosphorylase/glucosamine-1-phosphate N-acetyltransferase
MTVAIVLAAGEGTRMKSSVPKTLQLIAGRPMVYYPVRAALAAGADKVRVVCNPRNQARTAELLAAAFGPELVTTCVQAEPKGTGDAVRAALMGLEEEAELLILCGDTPLVEAADLEPLRKVFQDSGGAGLVLLSARPVDATGYGRVLRDAKGEVTRIREQRDLASQAEGEVGEVNAGMYCVSGPVLHEELAKLQPSNAQGEYYLTDIVESIARSRRVLAVLGQERALVGVNDKQQLAAAEASLLARIRARHAQAGVTLRGEPWIEDAVVLEKDAEIRAGAELRGHTRVAEGALVDVGSVIIDSEIGRGAVIKPYSVITKSHVGERAEVGPFAHLRPQSQLDEKAKVGNFVETKNTRLRRGAKASHLAYLGDGDVGEESNLGAGTIFCNYDGYQKHRTVIGRGVFVGSDSQMIAPVTIGDGAFIATASTVSGHVPSDAFVVGRVRPEVKPGYAVRLREKLAQAAGKLLK